VAGLEASTSRGAFRLGETPPGGGLGGLTAEDFVRYVQLGAAFTLFPLAILMSIFATASLVPRMLQKGAIDLLLSKPIGRPALFASRYLGEEHGRRYADTQRHPSGVVVSLPLADARAWDLSASLP